MAQRRKTAAAIILTIVTCGFYGICLWADAGFHQQGHCMTRMEPWKKDLRSNWKRLGLWPPQEFYIILQPYVREWDSHAYSMRLQDFFVLPAGLPGCWALWGDFIFMRPMDTTRRFFLRGPSSLRYLRQRKFVISKQEAKTCTRSPSSFCGARLGRWYCLELRGISSK